MILSQTQQTLLQRLYNASVTGVSALTTGGLLTSSLPPGGVPYPGHVGQTVEEGLGTAQPPGEPSGRPSGGVAGYYPDATMPITTTTTDHGAPIARTLVSLLTTGGRVGGVEDTGGGDPTGVGVWGGVGSAVEEAGQYLLTTALEGLSGQRTNSEVEGGDGGPSVGSSHPLWLISLLCFLVAICAAIVVIWFVRRRRPYSRLAVLKEKGYDYKYIYKPHGVQDDEYENTFVGVSVPLLQDITVI